MAGDAVDTAKTLTASRNEVSVIKNTFYHGEKAFCITAVHRQHTDQGVVNYLKNYILRYLYGIMPDTKITKLEKGLSIVRYEGNYGFDDLEQKLSDPQTTLMIICNSHNSVGKTWDKETFMEIGKLCSNHHVLMISDEIVEPNAFAVDAAIAAFTRGENWLDELRKYIFFNRELAINYIKNEVPQIKVVPSQATYLLWLDCTELPGNITEMAQFIREKTGLYLSTGNQFGGNGSYFLRMNIACSHIVLKDGLHRLKQGIIVYKKYINSLC